MTHVNQGCIIPWVEGDVTRHMRKNRKDNRCEGRKNPQRDWCMVVNVHVLSYSKPVLSLNVTKYDEGSTATAVETQIDLTVIARD